MTTRTFYPLTGLRHRRPVWLVLVVFLVGLGAPCVHCLTMAAAMAPAAPAEQPEMPAMPDGMPADCPMHAAHAKQAAPPVPAPAKAPAEAPAEAPCPKPGDCCLEQGKGPAATLDEAAPAPAPSAVAASVASIGAPVLPAPLLLPRELGSDRSHAPPAFNLPLRN